MKTETTGEIILPFRILKQRWLAFNIQHLHFVFVKYIYNDTFMIITQQNEYDRISEIYNLVSILNIVKISAGFFQHL